MGPATGPEARPPQLSEARGHARADSQWHEKPTAGRVRYWGLFFRRLPSSKDSRRTACPNMWARDERLYRLEGGGLKNTLFYPAFFCSKKTDLATIRLPKPGARVACGASKPRKRVTQHQGYGETTRHEMNQPKSETVSEGTRQEPLEERYAVPTWWPRPAHESAHLHLGGPRNRTDGHPGPRGGPRLQTRAPGCRRESHHARIRVRWSRLDAVRPAEPVA